MHRQQGFTILEVVIAFAILSVVTIVTVGLVTQNTMRVSRIDNKLQLMQQAESVLAELHVQQDSLRPGERNQLNGRLSSGHEWQAIVQPWGNTTIQQSGNTILPLWEVTLAVLHKTEQRSILQLSTLMPGK